MFPTTVVARLCVPIQWARTRRIGSWSAFFPHTRRSITASLSIIFGALQNWGTAPVSFAVARPSEGSFKP
jgi:hypothetical protein